jgi:hypothetical protein
LTYAVVKPHAVMIEFIYTTIASFAVLAVGEAVAIAELTEQNFIVFWRKCHLFIMLRPFVVIDYSVSWISK